MTIANREEFKEYCLRSLGKGVININISDEQVEDRVSDALEYYQLHHYDATQTIYYKHQVTANNIANGFIDGIPDNVIGVTKVFPVSTLISKDFMFDVQYQIISNNLYDFSSIALLPYETAMQHLTNIQRVLEGQQSVRFRRHERKVYVDINWQRKAPEGSYLLFEMNAIIDPEVYSSIWNDIWLKKYATALIKKNWGANISKFKTMSLPGGLVLNGSEIVAEAMGEIQELERQMLDMYMVLPESFYG